MVRLPWEKVYVREEKESSYGAMVTLILKGWDDGMIMRNKNRKLRSSQGEGREPRECSILEAQ